MPALAPWCVALVMAMGVPIISAGAAESTITLNELTLTVSGPASEEEMLVDKPFLDFAEHVAQSLRAEVAAAFGSADAATIELSFVFLPLVTREAVALPLPTPEPQPGERKISSPWLALSIEPGERPVVHAVVTWNEREMALDQARLSGIEVSGGARQSLTTAEWQAAIHLYETEVLLAASPEARSTALERLSTDMPADVFWVLTHAWQSTLAPFATLADKALTEFRGRIGPRYAAAVDALIAQGLAAGTDEQNYATIHDLEGLVDAGQLKVETLR